MSEVRATIHFYSVQDPYGEFSNFAPYPIQLDKKRWPTSEHYFQAQKFNDAAYREEIRKANSPMEAARKGRSRKVPLRKDWESAKCNVMRKAVLAKFTQHEDLTQLLLATGNAKLVEHTTNDSYWGDGGDGSGKNMLGQILMEVREQMRPSDAVPDEPEFRLVLVQSGRDRQQLIIRVGQQRSCTSAEARRLVNQGNIVVADSLSHEEANLQAKELEALGATVRVEAID